MNQTSSKAAQRPPESESVTLDCDHILTYAGGDYGQLVLLCANFLYELPIHRLRLSNALARRETMAAECAVQHLSNCLIVFGSNPMVTTMETLTAALRLGRRKQARTEWLRLQTQLDVLVPQVQRLMLEVASPQGTVQ
jgi:hypothetical protein